ncbi:MAG: ABC transporter permease subunit, partial [Planctomycetales bacterium]
MHLLDNPVLQRELIYHLRKKQAFFLLALYVAAVGAIVYFAWPLPEQGRDPIAAKRLMNMLFVGQFVLASLLAPSFAAGAFSGEKERGTFEMLISSPLKPAAVLLGKLLGSLFLLFLLIFSALPIVVLCLSLGGMSLQEVLAAYVALFVSLLTFGLICVACSSFFSRTVASLLVSYLVMAPPVLLGIW